MRFETKTVKGHGRGKGLGFPTINMVIPDSVPMKLQQGVHAVRVYLKDEKYNGALYYGPASTFGETELALEVYLIDIFSFYVEPGTPIEVEVVKFVRPAQAFGLPELLILQMEEDVENISEILNK